MDHGPEIPRLEIGLREALRQNHDIVLPSSSMARPEISELLELPIGERMKLVQELWDSIAISQDAYPISEAERKELDRRLEAYDRDPESGSSWDEVEQRITGHE